jgi:hypothetical protein
LLWVFPSFVYTIQGSGGNVSTPRFVQPINRQNTSPNFTARQHSRHSTQNFCHKTIDFFWLFASLSSVYTPLPGTLQHPPPTFRIVPTGPRYHPGHRHRPQPRHYLRRCPELAAPGFIPDVTSGSGSGIISGRPQPHRSQGHPLAVPAAGMTASPIVASRKMSASVLYSSLLIFLKTRYF